MIRSFLTLQHRLNPLHLYCRLLEKGLSKRVSRPLCRSYELLFFIWVTWLLKSLIHLCCMADRSVRIQAELRKISS